MRASSTGSGPNSGISVSTSESTSGKGDDCLFGWRVISGLGGDLRLALAGGWKKDDNFVWEGVGDFVGFLSGAFAFVGLVMGVVRSVDWVGMGSSAVRSMVTDLDLDLGREELAWAFVNVDGEVSIDWNAALANPNGVVRSSADVDVSFGVLSTTLISLGITGGFVKSVGPASLAVGVGEGETTGSDFFLPPPKKLFRVCCFPLNSSKYLVANLGGSGAVLGGSVG
jgi:hypothetical protein